MRSSCRRIPRKTQWELDHPAAPGGRHSQMVKIASALTHEGHPPTIIWPTLRARYGPDVPDREIEAVVRWATRKFTTAPGRSFVRHPSTFRTFAPRTVPSGDPAKEITRLLGGFSIGEADLLDHSPIKPSDNWREDSLLLISTLFQPEDRVNIVTRVSLDGEKPRPAGTGRTLLRDQWIEEIRENGVGEKEGGAWIRMNPVSGKGVSDQDVGKFRFGLLECDQVSLALQIGFFARLPLPIVAIITSGGRSIHAWLRINAPDAKDYRATILEVFSLLTRFGVDSSNQNPSRLARLPGVWRKSGGCGDARQRLLYLNPSASSCQPIFL